MANRNSLTAGIRAAALLLAFSWLAAGQSPSPAGRLETLKTKGLDAEVMVLPVRLGDRTVSEVGEVVAMSLEHGGMRKVDWTTQAFSRPGEATFQEISTAFGDYVRQSAITTEYTLYAEFRGTPGAGVAEIRGLLVDKGGNPVWSYRQTPIEIQNVLNEQQRLWQMARAIREYLRQTPAAADYAVLADYAFAPDGKAFTVHFVVCDHNGDWVIVDFQNDHFPDFQAMELKSGDDCDRLVTKRLDRFLRTGANGGQE